MAERLREKLSRIRALAGATVGRPTGFFVQYGYMDSIVPSMTYPAVEAACRTADPAAFLDGLADDPDIGSDPFWRTVTPHMGPVDTLVDYSMVRSIRPKRILEIGSGRSTHVLARGVAENGSGEITCIDPAPRPDISDLPVKVHARTLRTDDVALVEELEEGDILFIDSSHILQPGSDCDLELNVCFPALASGVVVHVHDVFLPFGYPDSWRPRNWNEACGLAPWVSSGSFDVLFPTHYLLVERADDMRRLLPGFATVGPFAGGSFWLRKR